MFDLTETQVELILACMDSDTLSKWLNILARSSEDDRKRHLGDIIGKMRRDNVDNELVIAVARLLHPTVFAAFLKTVND